MGHEIVYCSECQLRLLGTDFEKGKAFRVQHKSLCAVCAKKLLGSLPVPEKPKSSSQRIPLQKSSVDTGAHARLRPLGDSTASRLAVPPSRRSAGPLIGGIVGGLVVLAIVVAVASSSGGPPPPAPPPTADPGPTPPVASSREAEARAVLEQALAFARANPSDLDGQLAQLQKAVFRAEATSVLERARTELEAARLRAHQAVATARAELENRVRGMNPAAARLELEGARTRFKFRDWDIAVRRLLEAVDASRPPAAELWRPLALDELRSLGGATLALQDDGSVLVSGANPATDVLTFRARAPVQGATALRVEALPHPSLPAGGPGRAGNGNMVLSEIRVEAGGVQVGFSGASASYEQPDWPASAALDLHPLTGWGLSPRFGQAGEAVFHATAPFAADALRISLEFHSVHTEHVLGRFRLSVAAAALPAPPPPRPVEAVYGAPLVVYDEGLAAGWHDRSWGSKVDLRSAAVPPFGGGVSAAVEPLKNGGALYFGRDVAIDAPAYLTLAVYRVDETRLPHGVCVYGAGEKEHSAPLLLSKLGLPPVGQWRRYVIPLSAFKLPSGKVRGVLLQSFYSQFPAPPVYVDAVRLLPGPVVEGPVSPELAAYRERWSRAALLAAARDLDAAIRLLKEEPAPADEDLKKELAADLADLELLRRLHADVGAHLAKWPRGWNVVADVLDADGGVRRIDKPVRHADARGLELRSGELLAPGRILAPSLAEIFLARPKRQDGDARAAALLCAVEGFPDAAKRHAKDLLKSVPPPPDEGEARRAYLEAEAEHRSYAARAQALEKWAALSKDDAVFVRRLRPSLQALLDAPREFMAAPADLRPRGSFQLQRHAKGEIAWTLPEDVDRASRKDHLLDVEYSAPAGAELRGWALVGGCCQETMTFYLQGTDVEGPDADNPSMIVKCAITGTAMTPVVPAGIPFLRKTHAAHGGGKKETARFDWVALPALKRAGPGTAAKLRILGDQQGFAVAAVFLSAGRRQLPKEGELGEMLAARPFVEPDPAESGGVRGVVLREIWREIGGDAVSSLVEHPKFKGPPDQAERVQALDSWGLGDSYGLRFRGWLVPPATGGYVFWLASDDDSELWLSSDETPAGLKKVVGRNGAVGQRDWDAGSKSAEVPLAKGRRYYLELLHKQGGGGEHVAAGWTLPDGTHERPIPGGRLVAWTPAAAQRAGAVLDVPREHTPGVPLPVEVRLLNVASSARIEVYNGPQRLGEAKAGAFTWAQPPAGAHLLSARAVERGGRTLVSPPALVVAGGLHFVHAVDLNGPGGSVDELPWSGSGGGFAGFEGTGIELRPPTDGARARMIRSSVASRDGAKIAIPGAPPGKLLVYATLWAPAETAPFDLSLNGKAVLSGHRFAAPGDWARLGPWPAEAVDGRIELAATRGVAYVSGVEIWSSKPPAATRQVNTAIVGGPGGDPFEEVGEAGALLVGFRLAVGDGYVQTVRGIYRRGERENDGPNHGSPKFSLIEVLAKPGYAVGGLRVKGTDRVRALNVVFMKVNGGHLDAADRYESGWILGDAADTVLLGGDGAPVVGLHGRKGEDADAFGLIQLKR